MSYVANIYDSSPISPVAKIKENLSVWSAGRWAHFRIDYIEGIPWSNQSTVEMVTASGATTIAANGTIAKQVIGFLQLADLELLHLRWQPLDDMEGVLWEQASQGRLVTRSLHARVDLLSDTRDPWLAATTFFILGRNRDMNLEVRNPTPVAQALARFVFFGFRYILNPLDNATSKRIDDGQLISTYIPSEGRQA